MVGGGIMTVKQGRRLGKRPPAFQEKRRRFDSETGAFVEKTLVGRRTTAAYPIRTLYHKFSDMHLSFPSCPLPVFGFFLSRPGGI